jgi:hypothetical protein
MDALMMGWKRSPLLTFGFIALDFGHVGLVVLLVHRFLDDIFMKLVFPGYISNDFLVLDSLACDSKDCGEGLEMDEG